MWIIAFCLFYKLLAFLFLVFPKDQWPKISSTLYTNWEDLWQCNKAGTCLPEDHMEGSHKEHAVLSLVQKHQVPERRDEL